MPKPPQIVRIGVLSNCGIHAVLQAPRAPLPLSNISAPSPAPNKRTLCYLVSCLHVIFQCLEVVHKHSGDLRRARTELRRWESRTHVHGETREHRDVGHWEPFGEEEKTRFDLAILVGILDRNKSPENVLWNVQKAMPGRSMTELQHHQVIWEKTQAFEKFEKIFRKREKECYVCHKGNTRFTCAAFACDRAIHAKCCKHKTTQKAIGAIASTGEAGMAHKGKKKNSLPKVTYDLYCGQGCYDRASDADADAGAASPVPGPSSVSTATARTAVPAPASALSPVCSVISGGLSQCSRAQLPFGSAWRCTEPACTDPSPGAMPTVCQACEGDLHRLCGMEGNAGLRLCSSCGTTHAGKRSSS